MFPKAITCLFAIAVMANPTIATPLDIPTTEIIESGTITSKNTGFHELSTAANPYLLLCQTANCATTSPPSCYSYTLNDRVRGTCYNSIGSYVSARIIQPNTGGLGYSVYVGNVCTSPPSVALPLVNTCYNISPAGTTWYIQ